VSVIAPTAFCLPAFNQIPVIRPAVVKPSEKRSGTGCAARRKGATTLFYGTWPTPGLVRLQSLCRTLPSFQFSFILSCSSSDKNAQNDMNLHFWYAIFFFSCPQLLFFKPKYDTFQRVLNFDYFLWAISAF